MTQDVQPLTWQKRTNLEEHQQFFSKINEIIANLAPTVDEAEAAIAQATAAIASANDAIATANAASAAASAAASQAQTAASTVAGYDTRLTAAEGDIDTNAADITALQGRMGTAEGNITSLGTRMTAAESKNNQQDTAIAALQTADAQNVKINQVGRYAVDLTTDQDVGGIKKMVGSRFRIYPASPAVVPYIEMKGGYTAGTPNTYMWFMQCRDNNDVEVGDLILSTDRDGNSQLSVALRKADGTTVTKIIATTLS